jgi:hypothetical protein
MICTDACNIWLCHLFPPFVDGATSEQFIPLDHRFTITFNPSLLSGVSTLDCFAVMTNAN